MNDPEVPMRDRMDRMQQRRDRVIGAEHSALDREHFDLLSIQAGIIADTDPEVPIEERLASVRRRFRANHHARMSLFQEVDPQPVEVLEQYRVEMLVHETDRSGYRMSARPFLHTDPWWEPGYLDWDGTL